MDWHVRSAGYHLSFLCCNNPIVDISQVIELGIYGAHATENSSRVHP